MFNAISYHRYLREVSDKAKSNHKEAQERPQGNHRALEWEELGSITSDSVDEKKKSCKRVILLCSALNAIRWMKWENNDKLSRSTAFLATNNFFTNFT